EAGVLSTACWCPSTERPCRVAVIGAGPIGCELAQAFARFGAEVSLLEGQGQILTREDRDAAERVERAMIRDGVHLRLGAKIERVERSGADRIISFTQGGATEQLAV